MGYNRFQAQLTNDAAGATNPAFVHFDVDSGSVITDGNVAASIVGFLGNGYGSAINTRIVAITKQTGGVGTLVPLAFPTAEYAILVAGNTFMVAMSAYGVATGAGAMAPAGSSQTVSLYSTLLNRHGYGRCYLPFLSVGAIDSAGAVTSALQAGTAEGYNAMFLGIAGATWVFPVTCPTVVHSATAGDNPIASVKVSPVVSNLHTRRR